VRLAPQPRQVAPQLVVFALDREGVGFALSVLIGGEDITVVTKSDGGVAIVWHKLREQTWGVWASYFK
jgi:hypothetical protein